MGEAAKKPALDFCRRQGCHHYAHLHANGGRCSGVTVRGIPNSTEASDEPCRCTELLLPATDPWWQRRMLGLDFESTAADPLLARPVSCALVLVGGGEEPVKKQWLIDAGVDIPEEASKIHGISTADVKVHGHPVDQVMPEIVELLREHWTVDVPLVGMNCPYDLTLLAMELRRLGGQHFVIGERAVVDVKVLDKQCDLFEGFHRRGKRQLADLAFHYGAKLDKAHDACSDAITACRIAYRIGQRYPQIGNQSLLSLHHLQREWFRDQMVSLDEYFKKQGKPGVDSFEWPIRTLPAERLVP